ncbi:MAG: MFS transporter [Deltaproteobacteria bacterium]|nr:MFS transporter [Deltaproteobacteria bacterium]MDA8126774.1 MFS transporter [Deltaproteobacteria bacterium]
MHFQPAQEGSPQESEQPWQLTLYILFVAQLLSIIGFAFTLPFLPFYIRELGVADERLVPVWTGILVASASLVMAFFSPLWGWLSDRYGRKIMVERAMFGGAVITFAMGLIGNIWEMLFLRLLSGAATGTISASIAMISTIVPRHKLGYSLGLMQVAVFLGMTLGPWIGGILADAVGYRYTFMAGGVILFLGGMLVLIGARERFIRPSREALRESGRLFSLLAYAGFPAMLALFFFFHFIVDLVSPIMPLFIESLWIPGRGGVASTTGALFAISGGAAALTAGGTGYLSDRVGYKPILMAYLTLTAVCMLLHGMAQSVTQLALLRILFGIAAGGILPTMNALVGRLVPSNSYGKAYGLTSSTTCLGMAAGPFLGGVIASWWGYRWPFALAGALTVMVLLPIALGVRQRPRPTKINT